MTDTRPRDDEPRKAGRRIPPLVWIALALLVAWFIYMAVARKGQDVTPQGGTYPQAEQGPSVMPAAPASGDAPATPAGIANGPAQAPPDQP